MAVRRWVIRVRATVRVIDITWGERKEDVILCYGNIK